MIKASAVRERVIQLGDEDPSAVRKCRYIKDDGSGCCIVGAALVDLGINPAPFLADEDLNEFSDVRELFDYHGKDLGLVNDLSGEQFGRLRWAQRLQDEGATWGDAVSILR